MWETEEKRVVATALGLYVHVPFCEGKCPYCGFYSVPLQGRDVGRVVAALVQELGQRLQPQKLASIYIGGGSPSCLDAGQLARLLEAIQPHYRDETEFTVEVNPGHVHVDDLCRLRDSGVNRLSIGGQSFVQSELAFLGRLHEPHHIGRTVRSARQAGFDNIAVDLMFAIPGSTVGSWGRSLREVIALGVEHVSAYSMTFEKGTPMATKLAQGQIAVVDEDAQRGMYDLAIEMLNNAGLEQYEVSNFARPGRQCCHNLRYWANDEHVGVGPSAASYQGGRRSKNIADIDAYVQAIESCSPATIEQHQLDKLGTACETAVLNLRRVEGIELSRYKETTGFDLFELFEEPIERYRSLGLLSAQAGRLRLTRLGMPIADSVLVDFAVV